MTEETWTFEDRDRDALKFILSDVRGRRILMQMISETGALEPLAREDLNYSAGRHSVGNYLLKRIISLDAGILAVMLKELEGGIYE